MRNALLALGFVSAWPVAAAPVPAAKLADEAVPLSAARLLPFRKIQKELKLTPAQRIAIVDGLEDLSEAFDKKREQHLHTANPNQEFLDKLDEEQKRETEKFLKTGTTSILTPEARTRLKQINARIRGIEVMLDPAVQKVLGLTDAQKKRIEKAVAEQEEKIESYLNLMGNDSADNLKEDLLKFRTEQAKAIAGGFSTEQKMLWDSLQGEPVKGFDLVEMWITLIEQEDEPAIP